MKKIFFLLIVIVIAWFLLNNKTKEITPAEESTATTTEEELTDDKFVCNQDNDEFLKSTGLVITDELKEKYTTQISELEAIEEKNTKKYSDLAMAYRNIDDLVKSCEMFIKSIELDENNFLAFSGLGTVYLEMKDYKQSEKAFEKVLKLNPEYISGYSKLASLYQTANKAKTDIIDFYEQAVIKTQGNLELAKEYAGYLEKVSEYEKAIELWEVFVQKASSSVKEIDLDEVKNKIESLKKLIK